MGKHRNRKSRVPLTATGLGSTAAGLTVFALAAAPAFAAGNCGVVPAHTETIHHDAVTHQVTHTTPGHAEIGFDLQRWTKDVPATPAVTQLQTQVDRQHPGTPAVTHTENKYDRVVPGSPAVTQLQTQVDRQHPGTPAVTHTEYQFSKQVQACDEKSHTEYQFSKTETTTVPAQGSPTIPNPDYKPAWDETVTVTAAYTDYIKWDWTAPQKHVTSPDGPPPGAGWHQVGTTSDSKGSTPDTIIHQGYGNGSYFYYQSQHHDAVTKVVHHDAVGSQTIPNPAYKPAHTETVTVYKTASGTTTDKSQASWFTQSSFSGWTEFNSKKVVDQPARSSYTVYRTQNGGTTTDKSQAGWFTQSSFSGWTQFDTRTVTDKAATDPYTEYREQDGSATTDPSKAGWFPLADQGKLAQEGWSTFGEVRNTVITPGQPGYTEYYVHGKDPSRTLTDANWTTDTPKGWQLVDKKHVVVKPAVPSKTTHRTVVDHKAYNETVTIPAKDKTCPAGTTGNGGDNGGTPVAKTGLAETGPDVLPWEIGGGALLVAGVGFLVAARRRREGEGEES